MLRSVSCFIFAALLAESYALPAPRGRDVFRRTEVASTQYHATCANYAASIKQAIQTGSLALGPGRTWPDEFAWSGGFYVTPDQANAEAFGAAFLTHCLVLSSELSFDPSNLRYLPYISEAVISVKPLGTTGSQAQKFWNDQFKLGEAIQKYLAKSPSLPPSSAPIDEGIVNDDNPTSQTQGVAPPTQEQITDIREDTSSGYSVPGDLWPLYDDFANYDVVTGAVPMYAEQQTAMAVAVTFGMPAIQDPFIQVVLVTNTGEQQLPMYLHDEPDIRIALGELRFVDQQPLNPDLAKNQPALDQKMRYGRRGLYRPAAGVSLRDVPIQLAASHTS
ncbi:hypothetical protein FB451DRAFT_1172999 [Mycena latifolia]|nr:hypothetical protein FB451DRAFT_1172999 [Mycena latifolia]